MADILIPRGATAIPTVADNDSVFTESGGSHVTGNLDHSGLANGIEAFHLTPGFTGQIGTDAAPLRADVDDLYCRGPARLSYRPDGASDQCLRFYAAGNGIFRIVTGGTVVSLFAEAGTTHVAAPVAATNIYVKGGAAVNLEDDSSTDPTLVTMLGGQLTSWRGATTFNNAGGSAVIRAGSNNIGTMTLFAGRTTIRSFGTLTSGNFYAIPNLQLDYPCTITNCIVNMASPGADAFLENPLITFTNAPTKIFMPRSLGFDPLSVAMSPPASLGLAA